MKQRIQGVIPFSIKPSGCKAAQQEGGERERETEGMGKPGSQWECDWKREDVWVKEPVKEKKKIQEIKEGEKNRWQMF